MNFGLLGDDPAALLVVHALRDHPEHRLSHAVFVAESTLAEVMNAAPGVRVCEGWDEFLPSPSVDAVLVSGHDPDVLKGAKQLASAGKPLLVFPHSEQGATWVYEMTLVRDEASVLLFPVLPLRCHPCVERLRHMMRDGSLGRVLHLRWERVVARPPDPATTGTDGLIDRPADLDGPAGDSRGAEWTTEPRAHPGASLVTKEEVETALLPDVDLLRSLGGDYNQVTGLYSGGSEAGMSLATVTLAGDDLPEAVWSLTASRAAPSGWILTVTGDEATVQLSGGHDPAEITLRQNGKRLDDSAPDRSGSRAGPGSWDAGAGVLDRFDAASAGSDVHPDWTDLTRAFEIVDAVHRSVRRRRTIDLHFETTSERNQFKTQMTTIGCGLLVLTFLAVLLLLIVGALFEVNETVMHMARIAVFVPLVGFLLLQLLLFVARPSSEERR